MMNQLKLKMLCIIEECLSRKHIRSVHFNGSLTLKSRENVLNAFKNDGCSVLLITIKAGGEGITITEASRIIIMDPHWNPSVDDQAIDRAYRIGQLKNVIVYRLVTCGSIEEKIYARQVWKECMNKLVMENKDIMKHFDKEELEELFSLTDPQHSEMRRSIAVFYL